VSEWIELRVLESKARDANRPVVRIDPEVMERAGIMVGDVGTPNSQSYKRVTALQTHTQDTYTAPQASAP